MIRIRRLATALAGLASALHPPRLSAVPGAITAASCITAALGRSVLLAVPHLRGRR